MSHFLLLKFSSTKIISKDCDILRYLVGVSSLMYNKISAPSAVRSSVQRVKKSSIKNCDCGKVSSILVFDTRGMYYISDSNLFLVESILIWPLIFLYVFWFLRWLNPPMKYLFSSFNGSESSLIFFLLRGKLHMAYQTAKGLNSSASSFMIKW